MCSHLSCAHHTDLTPETFSAVAPFSLADMHRHFRVSAASIMRVMEAAGSSQTCYVSTGLQWLDQGDEQHCYHHLENLRSLFIWHSTSPWNLDQNLMDMRLYIQISIVVWVVWLSMCLWTSQKVLLSACGRSELLTAMRCLPCWDVTPCSLVDMRQDCNWVQGNQT